jgi:hypothetical protein
MMATNTKSGRRPARKAGTTKAKAKPVEDEIDELEEAEVEETTAKLARKKKAPAKKAKPVVEEVEDEDDEDEDDEEDEAPAAKKKAKKKSTPSRKVIEFGTAWLVEHIQEQTGKDYKSYDLRVLLRKMAKNGELEREVGVERGRYEFTGPNDKLVKLIVKKVKAGDIDKAKKDSLDKLKDSQAKKKSKKAAAKDEDVDDEEIDDEDEADELDDDDDE